MSAVRSYWRRVTRRRPCPVCGRPDWCLFAGNADEPDAVICARTESPKRCGDASWLHRLGVTGLEPQCSRRRSYQLRPAVRKAVDLRGHARRFYAATNRVQLARELNLSKWNLERLGVGWAEASQLRGIGTRCRGAGCWTFPMTNVKGEVLGIRLRTADGFKYSITGGAEGLFLPIGLSSGGRLVICEGPTDTASLLDLGFVAVGRPSCRGGVRLLTQLVRSCRPEDVVIVADSDTPGQAGARALANALVLCVPRVRVISPPDGIKDARAWAQTGATSRELNAAIDAAPARHVHLVRSRGFAGVQHVQ